MHVAESTLLALRTIIRREDFGITLNYTSLYLLLRN